MLTDEFEMRMLHMDQTLKGPEAHAHMKELLLDESVVSSDFRIIYKSMNVLLRTKGWVEKILYKSQLSNYSEKIKSTTWKSVWF